jgi:hypothetical protein
MKAKYYNLLWFFKSISILLFRDIKKPAIFKGYSNLWFADAYRVKREILWKKRWNQMGREQFILKFLPGQLLTCSKLELEAYKKAGLLPKTASIRKITKRSL